MSKPQSIKIDPWTDFPQQHYSLFINDFIHDKLFTLKVNSKSDKSTVNIKANINADKTGPSISDQVKLWFTLPGDRSVYTRIKSTNYIRLHYDHGTITQGNSKWNLYTSLNSNKSLQNISLRLGAANRSQHCHSDNRLRVDFNADHNKTLTWYNRTLVNHNKFTFGFVAAYGITQNILVKNNLLFGYNINDTANASIRIENNGYRKGGFDWANFKGYFDSVKVDFTNKYQNNTTYGLEGVFALTGGRSNPFEEALVAVQHYHAEKKVTVKGKLSSRFDLSLAVKYPSFLLKDIATATLGLHGSNLHNDRRTFKVGLQVQVNV